MGPDTRGEWPGIKAAAAASSVQGVVCVCACVRAPPPPPRRPLPPPPRPQTQPVRGARRTERSRAQGNSTERDGDAPHRTVYGTGQVVAWIAYTHAHAHAPSLCLLHVPPGSSPTRPMLDAQRGRAEIPPVTDEPWTVRAAAARSWWSGTRSVARRRCCMCSPRTATPRYVEKGQNSQQVPTTCEGTVRIRWKLEVDTFE